MPRHKRRKIVVEDTIYQWLVTSDQVHVWHPHHGHRAWLREHPCYDDWEASRDPVTPRDVAEFIYRTFLRQAPPPRPTIQQPSAQSRKPVLVPSTNPQQPDVYLLVKVTHWFTESGWGWLRTNDEVVAAFTDPMMAKVQAERLNPPYAGLVRELGNWPSWTAFHAKLGPQAEDLAGNGFALWKAVAMPLYGSRQIERWAA